MFYIILYLTKEAIQRGLHGFIRSPELGIISGPVQFFTIVFGMATAITKQLYMLKRNISVDDTERKVSSTFGIFNYCDHYDGTRKCKNYGLFTMDRLQGFLERFAISSVPKIAIIAVHLFFGI